MTPTGQTSTGRRSGRTSRMASPRTGSGLPRSGSGQLPRSSSGNLPPGGGQGGMTR